jgi:hypothetical protein
MDTNLDSDRQALNADPDPKKMMPIRPKSGIGTTTLSLFYTKTFSVVRTSSSSSVADPDPGSGAFLIPGFGIRNRIFPDPGSQTHIFQGIVTIF